VWQQQQQIFSLMMTVKKPKPFDIGKKGCKKGRGWYKDCNDPQNGWTKDLGGEVFDSEVI
jgi:hypothetical protein